MSGQGSTAAAGPLVVIAEDEFLIRLNIAEALRDAGCGVLEAKSSAEAMSFLREGVRPDVLFTDVHMLAGEDGLWLAEQYEAACPGIFIAVTSGQLDPCGVDARRRPFVPKPYEAGKVATMILMRWRAARAARSGATP